MDFSRFNVELLATYKGVKSDAEIKSYAFAWEVTIFFADREYSSSYTAGLGHCTRDRIEWCKRSGLAVGTKPTATITLGDDTTGREIARALKPFGALMLDDVEGVVYPLQPSVNNYLECLQSDARSGEHLLFEDFCGECGYDTDSRKAEQIWRAYQETRGQLQKLFRDRFDEFMFITEDEDPPQHI